MVYGVDLEISNRARTGSFDVEPLQWVVEHILA